MDSSLAIKFKEKIAQSSVLGIFMKTADPAFVEAAGYAGLDFTILDMEHGPVCLEHMQNNIRAAQVSGLLPIIRVPYNNEVAIAQALDIGAAGVQVPHITCAAEAKAAVNACKFYPEGQRGVCRFVRAAEYGAVDKSDYFSASNKNSLLIVQLEGQRAIYNIDEIIKVEGVDIIFIGPYDLSQSLGLPGQVAHPEVVGLMRQIVDKAAACGIKTGTFTDTEENMRFWLQAGVSYIAHMVDVAIFHQACSLLNRCFTSLRNQD